MQSVLNAEKQTTVARIEALKAEINDIVAGSVDGNTDDEHDPEGSTIAFERARVCALLNQAYAYLAELDGALGRIMDDTFGVCQWCGAAIPPERLAARPAARTCVLCPPSSVPRF